MPRGKGERRLTAREIAVKTPAGTADVIITANRHAVCLRLSLDAQSGGFRLTIPHRTSLSEAVAFAESNKGWMARRIEELPPRVPFAPGVRLPILGHDHEICHVGPRGRPVELQDGRLLVAGHPEHLPRRIVDYLKTRAMIELRPRVDSFAAMLDRKVGRLNLRDGQSRWGSCSPAGDLSFSWRLVLAPEPVLTYVAVHEVCHLAELNHSVRFWKLVHQLMPDATRWRAWLRGNGPQLLRYG